jgi:hypothetical protein
MLFGQDILVETLSTKAPTGNEGEMWQYHSRGDRHSKVSCWAMILDLLLNCPVLRDHAVAGRIGFGINHEIRDFENNRKKNLDLVICTPGNSKRRRPSSSFRGLVKKYHIVLGDKAAKALEQMPDMQEFPVGTVLMALEAKACMTAHSKALPRLHDELSSSHHTVHASNGHAIASGLVVVNYATEFISPKKSMECPHCRERFSPIRINKHKQPVDGDLVRDQIMKLPRRSSATKDGFDALAVLAIDCKNDGTPVTLMSSPPAPPPGDIFNYDQCVSRLSSLFASRFPTL